MEEIVAAIEQAAPEAAGRITAGEDPLPFPSSIDSASFTELVGGPVSRPLDRGRRGGDRALPAEMAIPILLDCDPGHDDAVAMLLAAGNDAVDLVAVTTVAGNCPLELATLNARRVAALAGLDGVPIAAGAAGPLQGELVTAPDIHGETGLDGYELTTGEAPLDPRTALELMADTLEAAPEPVTLVPTGPLTNVAQLLTARPDLHERIREIVLMGGSTGARQHHAGRPSSTSSSTPRRPRSCSRAGCR